MEQEKDLDFFQQALKAFDAPELPAEEPETEGMEPVEIPQERESSTVPKKKRWPAILSGCLIALLLMAVFFLDFGTVQMHVASRDLEEGTFFGNSGRDQYYKVIYPKVEDVAVGSRVEVSYFHIREEVMEDPNPLTSYVLPVWDELWAYKVKALPDEPTVIVPLPTTDPKLPEYILTVSIFDQPLSALALSRPKEYTIEIPLPIEDAEVFLDTFDNHTWVTEDMFSSGSVISLEKPAEGLILPLASYFPVGKFVLKSDAPLYREAYFSADGQFMQQGTRMRDLDLLYIILNHIRDAATEEDRLCMSLSPSEVIYGYNARRMITLELDGTARIQWDSVATDFAPEFTFSRTMHYIVVGDVLLMWPEDSETQELLGFYVKENGLQYSMAHSKTELEWLENEMLFTTQKDMPNVCSAIQFFIPNEDLVMSGAYETVSERYVLGIEPAARLQAMIDGLQWEETSPGKEATMLLQFSVLRGTDAHMLNWCSDGYLYCGNVRMPLTPEDWDFLLGLMFDLWNSGVGNRYRYVASDGTKYNLALNNDGRYHLLKDGNIYSYGRYVEHENLTILSDGTSVWYLSGDRTNWTVTAAGLESLVELEGASFYVYNEVIGEEPELKQLPINGKDSVLMQVVLPSVWEKTLWRYRTPNQTKELDDLLQRQNWQRACASGFVPEAIATIQVMVTGGEDILESVDLMPNGYLYHDTSYAKLSKDDWEELLEIMTKVSNTFLSESYADYEDGLFLNVSKSGTFDVLSLFALKNSGHYVVVGDYMLLDGKSHGAVYLKKKGDGWVVEKEFVSMMNLQEGAVFVPHEPVDNIYG